MNIILFLPLVNWGMGAVTIGVFAVVSTIMAAVVYRLANSGKNKENTNSSISE